MDCLDERRLTPVDARGVHRSLVGQSMLVAGVCLAVDVVSFNLRGPGLPHGPMHLVLVLVIIAADAALALPARYSGWVAVAFSLFTILTGILLQGTHRNAEPAGRLVAGYRAGAWLRGWSVFAALAALGGGVVMSCLVAGQTDWLGITVNVAESALLPWLVGRYTTARRAYIDELRHRRENELRDAAAEVAKAVAWERTAIARDLHDVISHHVSAIGVHAGAARMKLGPAANGVGDSLAAVETASRSAMADLRTMLDLLHGSTDTTSQPGLDNLDELFEGVRRSGLATRLSVRGRPRPVPGSLDIALFRITQEMLTNALRHGDGSLVEVELDYGEGSISLAMRNGMPPAAWASVASASAQPAEPGAGRGLAGIRTRAAMFHGSVSHGPDPQRRRWETIVTVPMEA